MIDPSIWADEDFGNLSESAMILFMGIISNADDEGRLPGNSLYLTSTILPYKGYNIKQATTIRDEVLSKMKSVILYEVDGKEYIQLKNWASYQAINRPTESKYPQLTEDSLKTHGTLTPNRIEENRIEKNRREEKKPSPSDLTEEIILKISQDYKLPLAFVTSKADDLVNWCKAKGKVYKDYPAALRNWVKKDAERIVQEQRLPSKSLDATTGGTHEIITN